MMERIRSFISRGGTARYPFKKRGACGGAHICHVRVAYHSMSWDAVSMPER